MSKTEPGTYVGTYTVSFYKCTCTPVYTKVKRWWFLTKTVTTYKHNPKCRVHNPSTPTKKEKQ